jgi:hypothetical protein
MNDLADGSHQYKLWSGAKEAQDAKWKEEEKIWQQFLDKYADYDKKKILAVVLSIINQLTEHLFINIISNDRAMYIAEMIRRRKFTEEKKVDYFSEKWKGGRFAQHLKEYLWRFAEIRNALEDIFANNKPAANKFLDDVLLINYNPKLKSFLFRVVANNKKNN